jgi:H+/Cl- antiporter ClcA
MRRDTRDTVAKLKCTLPAIDTIHTLSYLILGMTGMTLGITRMTLGITRMTLGMTREVEIRTNGS